VIAVIDIDGVLADASHRQHHLDKRPRDWAAFFAEVGADAPIERGRARLTSLSDDDHTIVLLSGRPESTRADTQDWLVRQGIPVSEVILRSDRDRRKAADFKAEAIGAIGMPDEVAVVIDDDLAVVERLAGLGYRVEHFR
jgi:hypothetical protein